LTVFLIKKLFFLDKWDWEEDSSIWYTESVLDRSLGGWFSSILDFWDLDWLNSLIFEFKDSYIEDKESIEE
jgi:hypothetical protein